MARQVFNCSMGVGQCLSRWMRCVFTSLALTGFAVGPVIGSATADNNLPTGVADQAEADAHAPLAALDGSGMAAILQAQPAYTASVQAFCSRVFGVNVAKSSYFPKLSLSVSSGDKMVDKTTRSDEFGGVNSPEYDGKGTDATLVLRQLVYDWGVTPRDIKISAGEALRANLQRRESVNTILSELLGQIFDHDTLAYSVTRYEELVKLTEELLGNVEKKYRLGSGTLTEVKELRLHMLERETRLKSAGLDLALAEKKLQKVYGINVAMAQSVMAFYQRMRAPQPEPAGFSKTLSFRLNLRDIDNAKIELSKITRSRFPKIEAEVTGRSWDLQEDQDCGDVIGTSPLGTPQRLLNDCRSSEVTGRLLLTMPLYDGGEKTNRYRVVASELRQYRAKQEALRKEFERQSAELRRQISDLTRRSFELEKQYNELSSRLSDFRRIQSLTQADIALVSGLMARQIDLEIEIRNNNNSLEVSRAGVYQLNDAFVDLLSLDLKKPDCNL